MRVLDHKIIGRAISGHESCIVLPQLDTAFDMGFCPEEAIPCDKVFITHGHMDHIAGILKHASVRSMIKAPPARYYVPAHLVEPLEAMFKAVEGLQNSPPAREIVALAPGERVRFGHRLAVTPFETDHLGPSQGYLVVREEMGLKPEYAALSPREVGALARTGVKVQTDPKDIPVLAYTGDTRATVLDTVPVLREVPVLIMETTFVADDISTEFARERGHTRLRELVERSGDLKCEVIVPCHFSMRHSPVEIQAALDAVLSKLPVRPLLP